MEIKRALRDRISDGIYCYRRLTKKQLLAKEDCRILMYHSVQDSNPGEDKMGLAVSPKAFYRHMKYLKDNKFSVIGLLELAERIRNGSEIPERSVAVTFDDGFRGVLTNALPVLKEFGFAAALFVNIYFIERKLSRGPYWRNWQTLDWTGVRALYKNGVTIGSHGYTHRRLTRVIGEELKKEIGKSKELIEKNIGDKILVFSYPHGAFNNNIKEALKEKGFLCSCSSIEGRNDAASDLFALRRTEITSSDDTMLKFEKKMLGSNDWLRFVRRYD